MFKMMKDKKGNEILQVLVIVAIIGAVAITITYLISSKLRETAKTATNDIGSGLGASVNEFKLDNNKNLATPTTTP
jgi:hypothetical protein